MRQADVEVKEVVCSETGKPMPKIPLWMADVKVKFISEEARQTKHPSTPAEMEPLRRSYVAAQESDSVKDPDVTPEVIDEVDADFDDLGPEAEELEEDFDE